MSQAAQVPTVSIPWRAPCAGSRWPLDEWKMCFKRSVFKRFIQKKKQFVCLFYMYISIERERKKLGFFLE